MATPAALERRRMQMVTKIGAGNEASTIIPAPSDKISLAEKSCRQQGARKRFKTAEPHRIVVGGIDFPKEQPSWTARLPI